MSIQRYSMNQTEQGPKLDKDATGLVVLHADHAAEVARLQERVRALERQLDAKLFQARDSDSGCYCHELSVGRGPCNFCEGVKAIMAQPCKTCGGKEIVKLEKAALDGMPLMGKCPDCEGE